MKLMVSRLTAGYNDAHSSQQVLDEPHGELTHCRDNDAHISKCLMNLMAHESYGVILVSIPLNVRGHRFVANVAVRQ